MGLLDSLKTIGGDALHSAQDTAYDAALKQVGVGTPAAPASAPMGSNATSVAGPSPISTDALHFTPSGLLAWAQANPVKGIIATLAIGGLVWFGYKKLARR